MKSVELVSIQDAATDDGQKAHAASVNALECRFVIALDQLMRGSCMWLPASEQDYWDTWDEKPWCVVAQGSLEVFRVRGPEVPQAADEM